MTSTSTAAVHDRRGRVLRLDRSEGDGMKVAMVDEVSTGTEFLTRPAFRSRPASRKAREVGTSPKVIVARGFAGPGANGAPLDRDRSFHGTFVAGIIAGVPTDVPAGRCGFWDEAEGGCHPAVAGVSGVAPRAYIGNYRVFNVTGAAR